MAARPFRVGTSLPEPLTVEETASKFGVPRTVVDAARRVLAKQTSQTLSTKRNGRMSPSSGGRMTAPKTKQRPARKRVA